MTSLEGVYQNTNKTTLCMKHIMELLEDISKKTQLQRKSNSQGYGGRHSTEIAKVLLVDVTDVND